MKAGIPAVVAMRRAISDRAAVAFAAEFYGELAAGSRIERAVAQGRLALFAAEGPVSSEWWTVALHLGSSLDAELTASPMPHVDADVQFSVARPTHLRVATWEPLLVLAHHGQPYLDDAGAVVDQRADVEARIAGFYGEAVPHVATTAAALEPLPRGATLVVVPDLPGLDCDPPRMPLTWTGTIAEVKFLVRAGSHLAGSTVTGWVRIFCGPLVIAETQLVLVVEGAAEAAAPSVVGQPVRRYTSIFPCFAPEDAELVEGVVAVAEALGNQYTLGVVADRRAGAPDEWMHDRIAESDCFQLFWSTSSMTSETCRSQWEAAIATARADFIRPLYWQDPFPRADGLPPPALAALRFVRLPVAARSTTTNLWHMTPRAAPATSTFEIGSSAQSGSVHVIGSQYGPIDTPRPQAPPPPPRSRAGGRWAGTGLLAGIVLTVAGLFGTTLASVAPGPPAPGDVTGSATGVVLVLGSALVVVSLVVLIVRWVARRR